MLDSRFLFEPVKTQNKYIFGYFIVLYGVAFLIEYLI